MELRAGNIVSISHYSENIPFQSAVIEVLDNEVLLNLPKKFSIYNLFEDDPVVMGFQIGLDIYAAECSIRLINPKDNSVALRIQNVEQIREKRIFERFPVSLYADMKPEVGERKVAYVRNLSLEGLSIISRSEFLEGDDIAFDTYIDNRVIRLMGTVMWKEKSPGNFQYGIKIKYQDFNTKNSLKLYLNILKDDQERAVMHLQEQK